MKEKEGHPRDGKIDVLVVGQEAERLLALLALPLLAPEHASRHKDRPREDASLLHTKNGTQEEPSSDEPWCTTSSHLPSSFRFAGFGQRVSRVLLLSEGACLRLNFHTIDEELLDAHLLHSLDAKAPYECVVVTYTMGNEHSLKHAEQLVKLLVSKRICPDRPAKLAPGDDCCSCQGDGSESALSNALKEPDHDWKVGPGLLVGVEPAPALPPLPPLITLSSTTTDAALISHHIDGRETTAAPELLPKTSKDDQARLAKRAVEIMAPFHSSPRRINEDDPWSALNLYEWIVETYGQLHPNRPTILPSAVAALLVGQQQLPSASLRSSSGGWWPSLRLW